MTEITKEFGCFGYPGYREYLLDRLPVTGAARGIRSRLARHLRVQPAFLSRVLADQAHLSLEHGAAVGEFLGHTEAEQDYFLLQVQHARAGSEPLRQTFERQMARARRQHRLVASRVRVSRDLTYEEQMNYYSTWLPAAVHMMLMVPSWRTSMAIAEHLKLPEGRVRQALEFLSSVGLAKEEAGEWRTGENRIHLPQGSPLLPRHHSNWRLRAMDAMDRGSSEDLFYSGPICISHADAQKIRALLLDAVERTEGIILPSKEETVFCLSFDFFRI